MAKPVIQLPGVVQTEPQAHVTSQFVQGKVNVPVPKPVLDLTAFSETFSKWVADAQHEAHERSAAQAEFEGNIGILFGDGMAITPEVEASRKKFKALQEQGKLRTSEDPFFRAKAAELEGRRTGFTIQDVALSEETLNRLGRMHDADGSFILEPSDINQEFDKIASKFAGNPALQNIYGMRAASSILSRAREAFHQAVSNRRDQEAQKYYTSEAVDQLSRHLTDIGILSADNSPEAQQHLSEAMTAFDDVRTGMLRNSNIPDPKKTFYMALANYVNLGAQQTPDEALYRIDLVRKMSAGKTTVGKDNSLEGAAFRDQLNQDESSYLSAAETRRNRVLSDLKRGRETALLQLDDYSSKAFAEDARNGVTPEETRRRLLLEASQRTDGYSDEASTAARSLYRDATLPPEANPRADEELERRLTTDSQKDIGNWIDAQAQAGLIPYTQASKQRARLVLAAEAWNNDPYVKAARESFDLDGRLAMEGRSDEAQKAIRKLVSDETTRANQQIMLEAEQMPPEKRAAEMGRITKTAFESANKVLDQRKTDLAKAYEKFDLGMRDAHGKGQSYLEEIKAARTSGVLTTEAFGAATREDDAATNRSGYMDLAQQVADHSIQIVASREGSLYDNSKEEVVRERAEAESGKWLQDNREKYTSIRAADEAFRTWARTDLRKITDSLMRPTKGEGTKGLESAAAAGGPTNLKPLEAAQKQATTARTMQDSLRNPRLAVNSLKSSIQVSVGTAKPAELQAYLNATGTPSVVSISQDARRGLALLEQQGKVLTPNAAFSISREVSVTEAPALKQALLALGAASPEELLIGSMTVAPEGRTFNYGARTAPATLTIQPTEVNIWNRCFSSAIELDHWEHSRSEDLRALAARYGVTDDNYDAWKAHQALILLTNKL